ncbi:hypothetical protein [Streptomyces sp. CRN 30]|uniref:hypothetical protein n=1 Tax=Streptomyces sp. CRN 30 TaxID=3075613 RepID=UPI002A81327B|nr:hypothetical protein [Streptomyces sp. CRN 30]
MSLLFAALATGQLVLAVAAVRYWRVAPGRSTVIPALICAALVWDNTVIALGSTLGTGTVLEALSVPRFVLHAFLTPLLVVWSLAAAEHAGIRWALRGRVRAVTAALTGVLIAAGVLHDVLELSLEAERWQGTVRYANAAASPVGPLPAIVTGLVVLVAGIVLWRRAGFPWLAVTAAVMVVVSGAAAQVPVLGNAAEVVLDVGILLTVRAFLPGRTVGATVTGTG